VGAEGRQFGGTQLSAADLSEVRVTYRERLAVGPVSLAVGVREAVAVVGPSGAGKTTLLRLLAGQVRPTAGRVVVGGRDLAVLPGRRELARLVGLVPQSLDLVPQLSVRHNVQAGALGSWGPLRSLAALLLPLEHPPARVAAERVGLRDRWDERVADLSGGERQRVALARLLVQDSALLLADEPVAALDPGRADDVLGLLCATARADGRALVVSLHAPELARRHVDRVVALRSGQVVFDLPAAQVTDELLDDLYRLEDRTLQPRRPGAR
jgi:phosphonate transport system ATP-binding protein